MAIFGYDAKYAVSVSAIIIMFGSFGNFLNNYNYKTKED